MKNITLWVLRIVPSVIMLQTLFFKFTAAPESVYIFSAVGLEPVGRIGIGVLELIAALLLLIPKTTWIGTLLGLGIMTGGILVHLFILGIEVMNDGGYLFFLALGAFGCCAILAWMERAKIPVINKLFRNYRSK